MGNFRLSNCIIGQVNCLLFRIAIRAQRRKVFCGWLYVPRKHWTLIVIRLNEEVLQTSCQTVRIKSELVLGTFFRVLLYLVTQSCWWFCVVTLLIGWPHGNCSINNTCRLKNKNWHSWFAHNTSLTQRNMKSQHLLKLGKKWNYLRFSVDKAFET